MSHLKQAQYKLSMAVAKLEQQVTGDDLCDLEKANLLKDAIYHFKETLGHACDTVEGDLTCLKRAMWAVDEDGELEDIIEKLTEDTDEPEDPNEHSTMSHSLQGTTPFTRR